MDVGAPLSTMNTTTDGTWRWNSPLPYLFGGLAAMLGLISFALLVIACTYRKSMDDENNLSPDEVIDEEKPAKPQTLPPAEFEPKIVVIMAGNDQPTYLAKPVSVIYDAQQRV